MMVAKLAHREHVGRVFVGNQVQISFTLDVYMIFIIDGNGARGGMNIAGNNGRTESCAEMLCYQGSTCGVDG